MRKIKPKSGQESVWDYPRPPRIEVFKGSIEIILGDQVICRTTKAFRIMETSHPPSFYLPAESFALNVLVPVGGQSYCEFKGVAHYYDIHVQDRIATKAAWYYPSPASGYTSLKNHVCVYAHKVDACFVNNQKVKPQEGDFYGGWITPNIVGPFKGGLGTFGW